MRLLASCIQSGQMLYIGSCGGAIMAGRSYIYVQQEMLGVLPADISIEDNEESLPSDTCESRITMTKKTCILWHGGTGTARSFVCTSSGVNKYRHLVRMIDEKLQFCVALSRGKKVGW